METHSAMPRHEKWAIPINSLLGPKKLKYQNRLILMYLDIFICREIRDFIHKQKLTGKHRVITHPFQ